MKKSTLFALLALVVCSVLAETVAPTTPLTPEEREARRQAALERRRAHAKKTGGLVECPEVVPSKVITVVNKQTIVPLDRLTADIKSARIATKLPIALDAKDRIAATITLVESADTPTLLIAPEDYAVTVNVKRLAEDNPDADKVAVRLRKEIIRGALMVLGSGYSQTLCFAAPVTSLKELDAISVDRPSPDTMMHLQASGRRGVNLISFASYRTACQQGWAPEPKNDEQRQVWDEVHAMPTKPMTIEPESTRKK